MRHMVEREDGDIVAMNQAEFGALLGGYIQPTISKWENVGCTSRRGVRDLDMALRRLEAKEREAASAA